MKGDGDTIPSITDRLLEVECVFCSAASLDMHTSLANLLALLRLPKALKRALA